MCIWLFFFFKQKTAYEMRIIDWSSDVCSSDLGIRNALAENVVQHYAAPSNQTDDGKHDSAAISSREAILEEIGTHFHGTLYRKGTVNLTIQNLVAERDYVAGRDRKSTRLHSSH